MFSCERPLEEQSLFTSIKVFGLLYPNKNIVLRKISGSRFYPSSSKNSMVVTISACYKLGHILKEG